MPPLSASDVLRLWEAGAALTPAGRALAILAAASPGTPAPDLAALPVGRRDRRLLEIRRETFGSGLEAVVPCPGCNERIEFRLDAATLLGQEGPAGAELEAELAAGEWRVRYRLPTAGDLAEVACCETPDRGLAHLLERCVLEATRAGAPAAAAAVPDAALALMDQDLARRDALAEVLLDFVCPGCGAAGQAPFDIARYLWEELRAEAVRLLREVDALARVYGWREADILALSAVRRQAYLELAAS